MKNGPQKDLGAHEKPNIQTGTKTGGHKNRLNMAFIMKGRQR